MAVIGEVQTERLSQFARPGTEVLASAAGAGNGFWFSLASHDALGDSRRQTAIADPLVRLAEAGTWTAEHPQEWARFYGEAVGLTPEAAELSQGRSTRQPVALADTLAREQALADVFHRGRSDRSGGRRGTR